jgi:uncharacterized membrane protein YhaH (DUF805 family)
MDFRNLFTSLEGRINRAEWWTGTILLLVVSTVLVSTIAGFSRNFSFFTGAALDTLVYLALFRPAYAVAAKRFQDRDKPGVTALYGLIPWTIASLLVIYAILLDEWQEVSPFALICLAVIWGVNLWFITELGILAGTPGPNTFSTFSSPGTMATRRSRDASKVLGGRLFTYAVSASGVVIMVALYNSILWMLNLSVMFPLMAVITNTEELTEPTLLTIGAVVLTASGYALVGFLLATPVARLALRVWPVEPFARRSARHRFIFAFCSLFLAASVVFFCVTFVGFFNNSIRFHELAFSRFMEQGFLNRPNGYTPEFWQDLQMLQAAVVRFGWSSVILGALYIFLWAHMRAAHNISRPFTVFLRRFSGFADRRLVVDVIRSMPNVVPVAFVASRADQARNWDPFTWAFGGLRLLKPLKNLPIQIKTTDKEWMQTVEKLLSNAKCVIIDLSDRSPSVEFERQLIDRVVPRGRVVVLAGERTVLTDPSDQLLRSAVRYSPRFVNSAASCLAKVGIIVAVWWLNIESVWAWLSLCVIPFLIMPAVSMAERKRIREAIQKAIDR